MEHHGSPDRPWVIDSSRLLDPNCVRLFDQYGFLQIEEFLDKTKVAELAKATLATISEVDEYSKALVVGTGRRMHPLPISGVFDDPEIYASPDLYGLFARLYGDDFVLNCFTCVNAAPGADDQHIHRDYSGLFEDKIDNFCPSFAVNLFVPLVPFNSKNGTTRVWPGSHRKPDLARDNLEGEYVDPELEPGTALLVDYRLKHSGTANHSNADRPTLCLGYSRDWFLDTMHYKDINPLQIELGDLASKQSHLRRLFSRAAMYKTQSTNRPI